MRKIYCILFFLLLSVSAIYTQESPQIPRVSFASPEASSLGKYGSFPTSYYTGVPSINILLYEIKAGEISFPINLSYHASGIRVDDIASNVGLGWSLNSSGCISVVVKGRPDILANTLENEGLLYPRIKSLSFKDFLEKDISTSILNNDLYNITYPNGKTDIEPDIYNYNFGNYTGQFVINNDNSVKFIKNSDGMIASYNKQDATFCFIDKFGKKFVFAKKEVTTSSIYQYGLVNSPTPIFSNAGLLSGSRNSFYSAWFLTQIVSENKTDVLDFIYELDIQKYTTRINGTIVSYRQRMINPTLNSGIYVLDGLNYWQIPTNEASFSRSYIEHTIWNLKEIRHNRSSLLVEIINSKRSDIIGAKKIDELSVFYQNTRLVNWKFSYSYFSSTWQKQESDDSFLKNSNPLGKRLKLSSIKKFGKSDSDVEKPYVFKYFFDDTSNKLAYRNCTNGFDHWGYFNAELNTIDETENVIKSFPATNSPNFSGVFQYGICPNLGGTQSNYSVNSISLGTSGYPPLTDGGDRNPSVIYAKALTLHSILFPTGGESTFEYENNSYSAIYNDTRGFGLCGGLRIKKIVNKTNNDSTIKEFSYEGGVVYSKPNYLYNKYNASSSVGSFYGAYDFNNYSDISLYSYGSLIGYRQVTENVIDTKTDQIIKTIYKYHTANDYSAGYYEKTGIIFTYPYKQSSDLFANTANGGVTILRPFEGLILGIPYKSGLLKSCTQFSGNNIIKDEEYEYDFITRDSIFGNRVKPYEVNLYQWGKLIPYWSDPGYYFFDIYFHETGKSFMKRKTEKIYDINGQNPVTKTTIFEYDTDSELLKSIIEANIDKTIKKKYKYPPDFAHFPMYHGRSNPFEVMKQTNRIGHVIEQRVFVNDKLTSSYIIPYNYVPETDIIKPSESFKLNTEIPLVDFASLLPGDGNKAYTVASLISKEMSFSYYFNGNIKEIKNIRTGITTTYLWGYNNQYPIAEIKNASYSDVESALGGATQVQNIANAVVPDISKINALRTQLPNAQVTTYTYIPLVGMASKTDPRGETTYFVYDSFNRLAMVRDNSLKLTQQYNYAYINGTETSAEANPIPSQLSLILDNTTIREGMSNTVRVSSAGGNSTPRSFFYLWIYTNSQEEANRNSTPGGFSYQWSMYDTNGQEVANDNSTTSSFSFKCLKPGTYRIKCTVTDLVSLRSISQEISVEALPFLVTMSNPAISLINNEVSATVSPQNGSGNYSYTWFLVDASTQRVILTTTTQEPAWRFTNSRIGVMNLKCQIRDNVSGLLRECSSTVNFVPFIATMTTRPVVPSYRTTRLVEPSTLRISSSVIGGSGNFTYLWEFVDSSNSVVGTSTSSSFSYLCSNRGIYTLRCTITDRSTNQSQTISQEIMAV